MSDDLSKLLQESAEYTRVVIDKLPKPLASIHLSREGRAIELCLDTSRSTYSEWIAGEGADICLIRDDETNHVVGVRLPLYAKTLMFSGDGQPDITFDLRVNSE